MFAKQAAGNCDHGHEHHRGGRLTETSEMRNMDEASMQYGFGMFWDMLVRCCVFSVWGQCPGPGGGWVLQGKSGQANSFGFEGWEVGRCGDVRADAGICGGVPGRACTKILIVSIFCFI